jgi:hypothetical protein
MNRTMREETQQLDNLTVVAESLTHATGAPFPEAIQAVRWVQAYVRRCVEAGLENDLLIAMERSGLGDVCESLIALVKPPTFR